MSSSTTLSLSMAAGLVGLAGCAVLPGSQELDAQAQAVMKAAFRDQGIVKAERLNQDLGQRACSTDAALAPEQAKRIEADALATIRWPTAGRYVGDWREGEKLAQSGRGMTWTDPSAAPKDNGGNCYNCHEIDRREISFGTIGPSLWNYGKVRGIKDVAHPDSATVVQYTWGKLWNSKAYAACSNMPRFGHFKLLDEEQIRHIMALLLDPRSPVNQ